MRCTLGLALFLTTAIASADDAVRFNRDIRPILAENCLFCHGPDPAQRKARLRLDTYEGLFGDRDGTSPIVPGKLKDSTAYVRITSTDADEVMPPPTFHKKLTAKQKGIVKTWIEQGAKWEPHWSFAKLEPQTPPKVKTPAWVRNPIDAFVLRELEKAGLTPTAEADRRTLARRLSFDLRGLPPSPEEVETFVADRSANAYEKLVDRFLASEHYGEHRARYWLDAARYADTHGLHFDNYREMWPYRDWVIGAFNRNLRFDQFTLEQLAGDLLPNPTPEQLIATGFHRCNITTNEGGTIAEENLANYARDRVETTATVWLGLTAGCCQCHNHPYDPISQKEFYQFAAYFRNTTQGALDGNISDTPPFVVVPAAADQARWKAIKARLTELKAAQQKIKDQAGKALAEWIQSGEAMKLRSPTHPSAQIFALADFDAKLPKSISTGEANIPIAPALHFKDTTKLELPGVDLDAEKPFAVSFWVYVPKQDGNYTLLNKRDKNVGWSLAINNRIVSFAFSTEASKIVQRTSGATRLKAGAWAHVVVQYDGSRKASGLRFIVDGKSAIPTQQVEQSIEGSIANKTPLKLGDLPGGAISDLRIFKRQVSTEELTLLEKWNAIRAELTKNPFKSEVKTMPNLMLLFVHHQDKPYRRFASELTGIDAEMQAIRKRGAVTHVMQENNTPAMANLLFRGQYNQPREKLAAATFSALNAPPKDAPANRLGLARWLIADEHPLTARVTVNRFWQELFGAGLVYTSEDFGIMGDNPSHPELLDWLAGEFRASGWDVKKFFKLVVMSNTYRQAATTTALQREKDPANRLLSRGPRFRMDAEVIRDNALAASGLLVTKIGGASVKPYQPDGVWEAVAMIGSNTRDYKRDAGERLYRRSLYTFWKRGAPPAAMDILNAPSREFCSVRRERTNTPLQALVTLNDPQFIEAARHLAQRALTNDGDRFDFLALRLLSRPFRAEERAVVESTLAALHAHYKEAPGEAKKLLAVGESQADARLNPAEHAAWTMLANQLFNLDEVLCK